MPHPKEEATSDVGSDDIYDVNDKFPNESPPQPIEIVVKEQIHVACLSLDEQNLSDDDDTCWHTAPSVEDKVPESLISKDPEDGIDEHFSLNGGLPTAKNHDDPVGLAYYFRRRRTATFSSRHSDDTEAEVVVDDLGFRFPGFDCAREHAGQFVKKMWEASWKATHFYSLPEWLQDNDFLHGGYRPPLPSFNACFKSIFRVHNETGNIWSHMLGCAAFLGVAAYFLTRPSDEIQMQEKLVFSVFFAGAIACLGLSFAFHTMNCHSERVGRLFCKLDYVGITLLIVGSFIPWLFYCFYCRPEPKIIYSTAIVVLGIGCVVVSLMDKFSEPMFRPVRAAMFFGLAVSGIIPTIHYLITEGYWSAVNEARFGWLMLMALLYICGTLLYAARIPERFFPGKCDIWFQSHQLFHLFVVFAAFVHYHGITEMAIMRLEGASCEEKAFFSAS